MANTVAEIQTGADPRLPAAFPVLTEDELHALEPFGQRAEYGEGEVVWEAGQSTACMFVVLEGEMEILEPLRRTAGDAYAKVATHRKGNFSGDIDVISGRPSLVSAKAGTPLKVLKIPGDCVKAIVSEQPKIGETILSAFLKRRSLIMDHENIGVYVIGSHYSPDSLRIREFLTRNHIPSHREDVEDSPDSIRFLQEANVSEDETPVVQLPSGKVLKKPSNEELADALGIKRKPELTLYDLVIIGAGPAGLAAAVYGASEGLSTLVVDSNSPGGQAGTSSKIENYMGFPLGISGQDLTDGAFVQAEKFGARFWSPVRARNITCVSTGGHGIEFDGQEKIESRCIILAPGVSYRKLALKECDQFEGRGVFYSATPIEEEACKGLPVAIVGGGNSAGQAAVFMAERAQSVVLVIRASDIGKGMSHYLVARINALAAKISVRLDSEITALYGDGCLDKITITNRATGESETRTVNAMFCMIGAVPKTNWLPAKIALDSKGFILTGGQAKRSGNWRLDRDPFVLETACPGVFAAGDARSNSVKRVASAVGEGSMAVALVHQYLSE